MAANTRRIWIVDVDRVTHQQRPRAGLTRRLLAASLAAGCAALLAVQARDTGPDRLAVSDRKSTRLNSSHRT